MCDIFFPVMFCSLVKVMVQCDMYNYYIYLVRQINNDTLHQPLLLMNDFNKIYIAYGSMIGTSMILDNRI